MKLKNIVLVPFNRGAVVFGRVYPYCNISRLHVLVPFYRGAVVFKKFKNRKKNHNEVLVPFYRGAVVFKRNQLIQKKKTRKVLVPFYRGAVVFTLEDNKHDYFQNWFSSPFIEERLYLTWSNHSGLKTKSVLVPFYRGAVVFKCQILTLL